MTFRPKSGGLANPMPSGTFLETIDNDDNIINLIGYLNELIAIGDLTYGNSTAVVAIDVESLLSGFFNVSTDGIGMELINDNPGSLQNITYQMRDTGTFEWKNFSSDISLGNGVTHDIISQSDLVANNDVIYGRRIYANNDSLSEVLYARDQFIATNITAAAEQVQISRDTIIDGVETTYQTVDENGITNKLVTRLSARLSTPDTTTVLEYTQVESNVGSDTYHVSICGGTTVPTDGEVGFTRLCQFNRATGGDAELYLNLGNSTSCKFRKVTTA